MTELRESYTGSRNSQRGMTTLGMIILVVFIGLFVFAGIRLAPAYLENVKVANTLTSVEESLGGKDASKRELMTAIEKRFDVESIRVISHKDVVITKIAEGWSIDASYVNTVPFIANIDFAVKFDNQITVVR